MGNPEIAARPVRSRYRPPERFHVFVSYTTREREVQAVKPMVDQFLHVLRPAIERNLGEHPFFYDGYTLYHHPYAPGLTQLELEGAIRFAIEESEVLVAFVSPEYAGSWWCGFEWATMASKKLRPWFDVCRTPPIDQLRDGRPVGQRPGWPACLHARVLRWLRKVPARPGGLIVPVVWKGDPDSLGDLGGSASCLPFDWKPCGAAVEAQVRVNEHLFRHGSVSPSWEQEAFVLNARCRKAMRATATAIVAMLLERRLEYARSG